MTFTDPNLAEKIKAQPPVKIHKCLCGELWQCHEPGCEGMPCKSCDCELALSTT